MHPIAAIDVHRQRELPRKIASSSIPIVSEQAIRSTRAHATMILLQVSAIAARRFQKAPVKSRILFAVRAISLRYRE
jgi:hypothetical protein